jgi:hypothetical protein
VLARVADLAERDLDGAMLMYLDHHVRYAVDNGWPLHSHTTAARNQLLFARRARAADQTPSEAERAPRD